LTDDSILSSCKIQERNNSYEGSIKQNFKEYKYNQKRDFNQETYFTEDKASIIF